MASAAGDFYFYTMLLLSAIRNDAAGIVQDLAKRNLDAQPIVDRILELNASRRSIQVEAEAAQAEKDAEKEEEEAEEAGDDPLADL